MLQLIITGDHQAYITGYNITLREESYIQMMHLLGYTSLAILLKGQNEQMCVNIVYASWLLALEL